MRMANVIPSTAEACPELTDPPERMAWTALMVFLVLMVIGAATVWMANKAQLDNVARVATPDETE